MPDTQPLDAFFRQTISSDTGIDRAKSILEREEWSSEERATLEARRDTPTAALAEELATHRLEEALSAARGQTVRLDSDAESGAGGTGTIRVSTVGDSTNRASTSRVSSDGSVDEYDETVAVVATPDLAAIVARMRARVENHRATAGETGTLPRAVPSGAGAGSLGGTTLTGSSGSGVSFWKDPTGAVLSGKYRLVQRIGSGGYGNVYLAEDERIGARVAIKVLHPNVARTTEERDGFRDEAKRVTELSHPHIVDWKAFDETDDGVPYFVMELLEGEELSVILKREKKLPAERVLPILLQTLDALRSAHLGADRAAILHLDLKPNNIFIVKPRAKGEAERVKVFDFGIGQYVTADENPAEEGTAIHRAASSEFPTTVNRRHLADGTASASASASSSSSSSSSRSSKSGTGVRRSSACTPEFASPEQCAHFTPGDDFPPLDARSDLYSLGVMGYLMLTGEYPYEAPKDRRQWLRIHRRDSPKKLVGSGLDIPKGLAQFIDRCLEKEPDDRWSDTQEAYEFLEGVARPSILPTLLKVLVPIVLVLIAGVVIYVNTIEVPPTPFALRPKESATWIAGGTVHLGPARPALDLAVDAELVAPTSVTVLAAETGEPAAEWGAEWVSGAVRVAPVSPVEGRTSGRVTIEIEDESETYRSEPFELAWLGSRVGRIEEDSFTLRGPETPARAWPGPGEVIDPIGARASFRVWGRTEDLESVKVSRVGASGEEPVELGVPVRAGETLGFTFEVGTSGPAGVAAEGRAEFTVEVVDRAGRRTESAWSVAGRLDPLEWTGPLSLEGTGVQSVGAKRYGASPEAELRLRGAFDRPVTGEVEVFRAGSSEPIWRERIDASSLDLPLGFDRESEGEYRLRVSARDALWHALPARGRSTDELSIVIRAIELDFGLAVAGAALSSDEVRYLSTPRFSAELFRPSLEAARVRVAWQGRGGVSGVVIDERLEAGGSARTPVEVELPGEGFYSVGVEAFWIDSVTGSVSATPQQRATFLVAIKSNAPEVELTAPSPVVQKGQSPSVGVVVRDDWFARHPADGVASGIRLDAELIGPDGVSRSVRVPASATPGESVELAVGTDVEQDSALADGHYELIVRARDAAGNESDGSRATWEVARHGPEVALREPDRELWLREGADWRVRVELRDPNGVERVTGTLKRVGDEESAARPIELTVAEAGDTSSIYEGRVSFEPEWSEARVELAFEARDRHGNASEVATFERRLPEVTWRAPARVRWVRSGLPPLELVSIPEGPYVFGGRGDREENELFRAAGLGDFAPRTTTRSWALTLDSVPAFFVGVTEVTRGQFRAFVDSADGYTPGPHWATPPSETRREEWRETLVGDDAVPVTGVTWLEADAFCRWVELRLPGVHEWEIAVRGRGVRPRAYASQPDVPNGERPGFDAVNRAQLGEPGRVWAVGTGADVSPEGARDLCGNVSEWTASPTFFVPADERPGEPNSRQHYALHLEEVLAPWRHRASAKYFVVGGSFEQPGFDFGQIRSLGRTAERRDVGFRVAVSADRVRAFLVGAPPAGVRVEIVE